MLSGIGPSEELTKHGIEVVHDLPVGRNLMDHSFVAMSNLLKRKAVFEEKSTTDQYPDPSPRVARPMPMGFVKDDAIFGSKEFTELEEPIRLFLQEPTVPTYEFSVV